MNWVVNEGRTRWSCSPYQITKDSRYRVRFNGHLLAIVDSFEDAEQVAKDHLAEVYSR